MNWLVNFAAAAILTFAMSVASYAQQQPPAGQPRPLRPNLKPEARADEYVVEIGRGHELKVLENDIGVPPAGQPQPSLEAVEVESAIGQPNQACGVIRPLQSMVYYEGRPDCVGKTLRYTYKVKLRNEQTNQDELVTGQLTIKVVARSYGCDTSSGRYIKIDGGTFDKTRAPHEISDIVQLVEGSSFTVAPFCMTLDPISVDEVTAAIAKLPPDRTRLAELRDSDQVGPNAPPGSSRRMAELYAEAIASAGDPPMTLPTIEELVAAAWVLQLGAADSLKTKQYLLSLRTGGLLWTSTPCDSGPGKFFVVGPMQSGMGAPSLVDKLCYAQQRRYRAGFRLVYR